MYKITDRYLYKELLFPFLTANTALVIIGIVDVVFSLIDYLINRGVGIFVVIKLLAYKIPAILVLFMPIATLFAVMIVIIRMIKDDELIVFWTSGISYDRILVPIIIFALFVTGFALYLEETLVPWTNYRSNTLVQRVVLKKTIPFIEENVFFKDSDNRYFYIKQINKRQSSMEGIMMYELGNNFPQVVVADKAEWNGNFWSLYKGHIHRYGDTGFFEYEAAFDKLKLRVDYDLDSSYQKVKNTKEMSSKEIGKRIKITEKAGLDSKKLRVEYYMKFAMPFSNFVFAVIGIVLIFLLVRSPKDVFGVVLSILLSLLSIGFFIFLMAFFRALSIGGAITPFIGAWAPNFIYITLSSYAWAWYRFRY